ncbi:protein LTO1 homolog isoform X2 [Centroberyx affinis]|uniref:protein LTO1 homolog isoform X2 n=1 Tax=Centroberyx affinis TaxID=166261 RepID=UPI003A5BF2E2
MTIYSTASSCQITGYIRRATERDLRGGPDEGCGTAAYMDRLMGPRCPLSTDAKSRKRVKALEALLALIQKSPLENPQSPKLQEDIEKLRAKFRQVCSLLNVPADFKDYVKNSSGVTF